MGVSNSPCHREASHLSRGINNKEKIHWSQLVREICSLLAQLQYVYWRYHTACFFRTGNDIGRWFPFNLNGAHRSTSICAIIGRNLSSGLVVLSECACTKDRPRGRFVLILTHWQLPNLGRGFAVKV